MTRTIGKLADRLLSAVVPHTSAAAEYEYKCEPCYTSYNKRCSRYCASGCSAWYCEKCGTC